MVVTEHSDPTEDHTANTHAADAIHEHHAQEDGTASDHPNQKLSEFSQAAAGNPGPQQTQDLPEAENREDLQKRVEQLNKDIEGSK